MEPTVLVYIDRSDPVLSGYGKIDIRQLELFPSDFRVHNFEDLNAFGGALETTRCLAFVVLFNQRNSGRDAAPYTLVSNWARLNNREQMPILLIELPLGTAAVDTACSTDLSVEWMAIRSGWESKILSEIIRRLLYMLNK